MFVKDLKIKIDELQVVETEQKVQPEQMFPAQEVFKDWYRNNAEMLKMFRSVSHPLLYAFDMLNDGTCNYYGHRRQYIPQDSWYEWNYKGEQISGNWTKRFGNAFYKAFDVRIDKDVLQKMGDLVAQHLVRKTDTYYFQVSRFMDWYPGNFNESAGSCWWDEDQYAYARRGLRDCGRGYSILFYENEKQYQKANPLRQGSRGIGRCWLYENDDGSALLFNGYGLEAREQAKILSQKWGLKYKLVDIYGNEDDVGYVNGESGYVLYDTQTVDLEYYPNYAQYGERREVAGYCDNCSITLMESDEHHWTHHDYMYCEDCASDHCYYCGEYAYGIEHPHYYGVMCESCAISRHDYCRCSHCEEVTDDYSTSQDGVTLCSSCYDTDVCKDCDRVECSGDCKEVREDRIKTASLQKELEKYSSSFTRWSFEFAVV